MRKLLNTKNSDWLPYRISKLQLWENKKHSTLGRFVDAGYPNNIMLEKQIISVYEEMIPILVFNKKSKEQQKK